MINNIFGLKDFKIDRENNRIIACSQGNICIESKYIQSKKQYYARFNSEQCKSCSFTIQCPIKIKNKYSIARFFNSHGSQQKQIEVDMHRNSTSRQIQVIPNSFKVEDDYVTLLEKGISLKHIGKLEEAKDVYIKAINLDNTHPNGYHNLAKVLYALGDYKASAKAYKASFERGICELQQSMQVQNKRFDTSSFYIHLGHALLDEGNKQGKYSEYIKKYEEGIDPRRVKGYKPVRGQFRDTAFNEYDKICVVAAKKYLAE